MAIERDLKGRFIKGHKQSNTGKTHFIKGLVSWNKGSKGLMKPNKTSFKKGERRSPETEFKPNIKRGPMSIELKRKLRLSTIKRIERQKLNGLPLYPSIGKYEKTIIDNLEIIFGYKIIRQKRVAGYFIDGYCPMLNLAIEIDELYHKNKIEKDLQREQNIINEIGCSFLRLEA